MIVISISVDMAVFHRRHGIAITLFNHGALGSRTPPLGRKALLPLGRMAKTIYH